jgi:hypothetical protein
MTQEEQPPIAEAFAAIIAALHRTIWGRNAPITPVLLPMIWRMPLSNWLSFYARRFAAIVARWNNGTLRRPPVRAPRDPAAAARIDQPPRPPATMSPEEELLAKHPLPRGRGWLAQVLSWQGARMPITCISWSAPIPTCPRCSPPRRN